MIKNLNEIKNRLGEKVHVTQKPSYHRIEGIYILSGLQQTIELNCDDRPKWTTKILVRECDAKCGMWLSAENTTISFISSEAADEKSISDIQAETIKKIKSAIQ